MKVVYCIAGTYNSGGMERVLTNKANWLINAGYEVVIVTTDQRGQKPFFPLNKQIQCYDLGINYELNNGKSFVNKITKYPYKLWKHKRKLNKLLKQLKADIVVSMFCNDVSILPQIKDGSKKVLEVHFSRFKRLQYGRKGFWKLADEWRSNNDLRLVSYYDRFVVLTQEDKSYWGTLPNMEVIANAHTYSFDHPAKLDNKIVIAVGRYEYQKGFDRLIDAWKLVSEQAKDWKLYIIGDGIQRKQLLQQIEAYNLSESIQLMKLSPEKMKEAYLQSSIATLSSRYEGLPMVLLEAQAAGLPIVSFACKCGPRDIIKDGENGFLVNEGEVKELASSLLKVIQNTPLRKNMGEAAYQNSEKFAEEKIMQQWNHLFHILVK